MISVLLTEQEAAMLSGLLPRLLDAYAGSGSPAVLPAPAQVAKGGNGNAKNSQSIRNKCTEELIKQLGKGFARFVN